MKLDINSQCVIIFKDLAFIKSIFFFSELFIARLILGFGSVNAVLILSRVNFFSLLTISTVAIVTCI
jgi:hypothetical protein